MKLYQTKQQAKIEAGAEQPEQPEQYEGAYSRLVLWASFAFAALLGFSRLSYGLLLPAIRADLSGSFGVFGLVGTLNLVGYLVGSLLIPWLTVRWPNRPQLIRISLVGVSLTLIGAALCPELWSLGVLRLANGIFSGVALALILSLTLERIKPAQRGQASGLVWLGGSGGIVISGLVAALITGLGANWAWRAVWLLMGLATMAGTSQLAKTLAAMTLRPSTAAVTSRQSFLTILGGLFNPKNVLWLTLSYFCFGFGYIIYATYFVTLLTQQGVPIFATGLVWAGLGAAGVAGGLFWGRLTDIWPNGFILATTLAMGMVGTLAVLSGQLWLELVGAALVGSILFSPPSITTVLLKLSVPPDQYTASFGILVAIFAVGQLLGPVASGFLVDNFGLQTGTASSGLVLGAGVTLALIFAFVQKRSS